MSETKRIDSLTDEAIKEIRASVDRHEEYVSVLIERFVEESRLLRERLTEVEAERDRLHDLLMGAESDLHVLSEWALGPEVVGDSGTRRPFFRRQSNIGKIFGRWSSPKNEPTDAASTTDDPTDDDGPSAGTDAQPPGGKEDDRAACCEILRLIVMACDDLTTAVGYMPMCESAEPYRMLARAAVAEAKKITLAMVNDASAAPCDSCQETEHPASCHYCGHPTIVDLRTAADFPPVDPNAKWWCPQCGHSVTSQPKEEPHGQ